MSNRSWWPNPALTIRNSARTRPGRRGRWNDTSAIAARVPVHRNRPKWTTGGPTGLAASTVTTNARGQ